MCGSPEIPLALSCHSAGQSHFAQSCLWLVAGIIAKEPTSLEEEIKEIRRSGSGKDLDTPEFELSDIFYFCRKGIETIMDDEVTKRFSAEELESWNLLSRTNYNFHYISLRLTVLWGLGVVIRYCFLLPLRWVLLQKPVTCSWCNWSPSSQTLLDVSGRDRLCDGQSLWPGFASM